MGPGRVQEHVRPRVIASWDGRDAGWQPEQTGPGEFDRDVAPLIRAVRAPAVAAGLPERDADGKRGYVWHCSAGVAAGDRVLSDAEWASVARELLDGAGVAEQGDAGGPRWVAIRHADDHVHIAVVLVRQDSCRRFWPSQDYPRLRETAQRIEQRLGLTVTAAADGTAARAPGRGEIEKTRRQGRKPARVELARAVRVAAVAADGPLAFLAALEDAGYLVELRQAPSGDPLGYKVARRGDITASGEPVFYSGSKLAPDLSLPRLMRAWGEAAEGSAAAIPVEAARRRVERARAAVCEARSGRGCEDPDGIAHATRDVLTALAGYGDGLSSAADAFDRAARPPRGAGMRLGRSGAGLRRVAPQLVRRPRGTFGSPNDGGPAVVVLVVALAALLREVAAWQREHDREHQAAASRARRRTWSAFGPRTERQHLPLWCRATRWSRIDHGAICRRRDAPASRAADPHVALTMSLGGGEGCSGIGSRSA
ncbi:relaxase/mobilization nuclease domain-containing protein [Pseudonocardia yunnanensis]|uniref:Relaxase/mobilization nuclease domain-containing protein n=1 Tax=Pseudonocardia yunnanensis TaxID=58107 RepID=A0ABW4F3H5_9PSEU